MKDLRIEFKFKNAVLLKRLQEKFGGEATTKSMAEGMGVGYGDLIYLLGLGRSPFTPPGGRCGTEIDGVTYSRLAMKIADFLLAEPAEIFPVSLYSIRFPKKYYKEFESVQLLSFQEAAEQKLLPPVESYEENYEALGLKERMGQLLGTLTAREEKIIRLRFGLDGTGEEKTLEEVGNLFCCSKEHIRQVEKKALRRLRHPLRAQGVKVFYTGEEPPPEEPEPVVNPVVERIRNRIREKVKPEVREAVLIRVKELEPLPMEKLMDLAEDPGFGSPLPWSKRVLAPGKC